MPTIVFDAVGVTPTPPPSATGMGLIAITGVGFGFADLTAVGAIGFGRLTLVQNRTGAALAPPTWGSGGGVLPLLSEYSFGAAVMPDATAYGVLPFSGRASAAPEYGFGVIRLAGYGAADLEGGLGEYTPWPDDRMSVEEQLQLGSADYSLPQLVFRAIIGVGSRHAGQRRTEVELVDELRFAAAAAIVFPMLVSEGLVLSDLGSFSYQALQRTVDRLLLTGQAASVAEALEIVQTAIAFQLLADLYAFESVSETIDAGAAAAHIYESVSAVVEALLLQAAATPILTGAVLVSDAMAIEGAALTSAELTALITESIGLVVSLAVDNGQYVAWVMNTQSKALTTYENYPFNSFAELGGRHYGADSTGIYRLGGDTDDGAAINAKLRLGLSSLGSRLLKRVPEVYIGYSSTGTLLLKVITVHETTGEKLASHYTLPTRGAANIREHRFEPGKGLKSVDWDFEIENVDGADFELDSIQFRPMNTSRRTRS